MVKLIGIAGKAGAGKDTIVEQYVKTHGHPLAQRLAFGDGVKKAAAALFGEDLGKFYKDKEQLSEQWGISYREMLQKLGTEFARDMIDPDFWVKTLDARVVAVPDSIKLVFITDVRFDNEADYIHRFGGIVIEVVRPEGNSGLTNIEQLHASESGVARHMIDYSIVNHDTPEALGVQMVKVLHEAEIVIDLERDAEMKAILDK